MQTKKTTKTKYLFNETFKQTSPLGSHQFFTIITAIFLLTYQTNEFLTLILGLTLISTIAIPIRIIFYKERPDKTKFNNIIEKIHAASFPSLHSTRATFLTLFLVHFFEKEILISTFITIIGLIVIYGRIYRKRHYPIDVVAGITLGIITYTLTFYILQIFI